jgi:UDP-glucose 4-epimerase
MITGGTGSFGNAVLKRFLDTDIAEIRIFSRDEKKQDDMRKRYASPKLKFYIGDVRDYQSILNASRGVDFIFHAAALKLSKPMFLVPRMFSRRRYRTKLNGWFV